MIDKLKGIIARKVIKNERDYCMYCILDTVNKNINSISYKDVQNTIGKYFDNKTFASAWMTAKANHYIIPIDNSNKYIIGVNILSYEYEYLL